MSKTIKVLLAVPIIFFFLTMVNQAEEGIEQSPYDVLIKNARIFDGSGKDSFRADIAIRGDTIVKISRTIKTSARRVIEAPGLYLSPGFIDLHTHAERDMYFPENRAGLNYLKQGVTSLVVGQCGQSAWPIFEEAEDQISRWTKEGIGPNAALLVGHGTVRQRVMGMEDRAPTTDELGRMKELVKRAMDQGASGISTGLIYRPGIFSKTDEIIELVRVVKSYNGIYHTHIRDERDKLLDSINEAIEICRTTGVPTHISHFKVMGSKNWGLVKDACELIENAREEGLAITADQYPYRYANGYPYRTLLPTGVWSGKLFEDRLSSEEIIQVFDFLRDKKLIDLYEKITPYYPLSPRHKEYLDSLTREELLQTVAMGIVDISEFRGVSNPRERLLFLQSLENPQTAESVYKMVETNIENRYGPENIFVGVCHERELEGKNLVQVAKIMGKSIGETAVELELMDAKCIPFQMCEPDIEYIMKKDYVSTGSDGTSPSYQGGLVHSRAYSTFLHKIKKYALDKKAVSVAHVIRSQTSLSARIMNWNNRGWIKEGYKADIVVFDLKNIKTPSSISNSQLYSEGVIYLLINGELVISEGKFTGNLPGRIFTLKE
ncbi:amidohydrolase family protein [Acidobacteriota bacterium]